MERWRSSALPGGRWLREAPPSTSVAALPPSVLMMRALRGGERVKEGGERGREEKGKREREMKEDKKRRVIISLSIGALHPSIPSFSTPGT